MARPQTVLTVVAARRLTPHLVRLTLGGEQFDAVHAGHQQVGEHQVEGFAARAAKPFGTGGGGGGLPPQAGKQPLQGEAQIRFVVDDERTHGAIVPDFGATGSMR